MLNSVLDYFQENTARKSIARKITSLMPFYNFRESKFKKIKEMHRTGMVIVVKSSTKA